MEANALVAVASGVDGAQVSGAIVFWRLSGVVAYEGLRAAWAAAGLDEGLLPAPVSRSQALARTMATFREPGVLVRPLKVQAESDPEGFILVHEEYDAGGRPQYHNGMEVRLLPDKLECVPEDPELVDQIGRTFIRHLGNLSQQDVSGWLVDLVRGAVALRLRDTGGIYFVPRSHLPAWRAYVGAIRAASACRMFEIPALQTDEAVATVLDALTRETETAAEDMADALDAAAGPLSDRSRKAKAAHLAAVERKVLQYESLLGVKLAGLHEQLETLQARIAQSALMGDGE